MTELGRPVNSKKKANEYSINIFDMYGTCVGSVDVLEVDKVGQIVRARKKRIPPTEKPWQAQAIPSPRYDHT